MRILLGRVRGDDAPEGARVLVDRLWPRGVSKESARLDLWAKNLAPSTELRRWFHADRDGRRAEFADRYRAELDAVDHADDLAALEKVASGRPLVLLGDTKDVDASQLPVLASWLEGRLS